MRQNTMEAWSKIQNFALLKGREVYLCYGDFEGSESPSVEKNCLEQTKTVWLPLGSS